jgi:5'-3' exonuclease
VAAFKLVGSGYNTVDTLVLDVSYMAHRHAHALGQRMTTSDGRMSGHVFGCFKQLRSYVSALKPRQVVFAYDRGCAWRKALVPAYKAPRSVPDGAEKKWSPGPDIERFFRNFPGLHLAHEDCEADDMIAWYAERHRESTNLGAAVIYSNDRDLWQLIDDTDEIACIITRKPKGQPRARSANIWVKEESVREDWGVLPKDLAKVKALMGDPSDNIKGLIGARKPGKKDALRAFAQDPSCLDYFNPEIDSPHLNCKDWLVDALLDERDRLVANHTITDLRSALPRVVKNPKKESHKGDLTGAMDVLLEFECESLLSQTEPVFNGLQGYDDHGHRPLFTV